MVGGLSSPSFFLRVMVKLRNRHARCKWCKFQVLLEICTASEYGRIFGMEMNMQKKGPSPIVCSTCCRHCRLNEGETGFCRARRAEGGRVVAGNYGRITSLALDPIEKKPIAFFRPGSCILSVGSYGCNLRCPFCQNDSISQRGECAADLV